MVEASGVEASARLPLLHIVHTCRREQSVGVHVLAAANLSVVSDMGNNHGQ